MKCPHCEQEHSDNAKFCPITGKRIVQTMYCQVCGEKIEATWAACPMCGTPPGQSRPPAPPQKVVQVVSPVHAAPQPEEAFTAPEPEATEGAATQFAPEVDKFPGDELPPPQFATLPSPVAVPTPVPAPAMELVSEPIQVEEKPKRRRTLSILACGCVGVPLVLLLLVALLVVIDPLKLHVWGRLNGSYDSAAEMMPANTGMYLGVNIGNALLTRVDRVINPFLTASGQASPDSPRGLGYLPMPADPAQAQQISLPGDLLKQIEDATGVKIPDDLTPWVGQYGGIGLVNFQATGSGSSTPSGWIIAMEARDTARADAFLETLRGNLMDLQHLTFTSQTYKGAQLIVEDISDTEFALSFGRSGRMLLIASGLGILQDAIDTQGKGSLAGQADYDQLAGMRPRDWSASMYVSRAAVGDLAQSLLEGVPAATVIPLASPLPFADWNGMLVNAAVVQNGVRLDLYTTFDASTQSAADKELMQSWSTAPAQVIQMMPQDTLIYFAGSRFDFIWAKALEAAFPNGSDRQNFLDGIEQTLGFSLQDDLFNHMNGQYAFYAVPSTQGLLPSQSNVDLAVSLLAQIDDPSAIQKVADWIGTAGLLAGISVDSQEQSGVTYYELNSIGVDFPVFAFGAGNGYVVFGTDLNAIQTPFSNATLLTDASRYRQAAGALPGGMQPSVYVDLQQLFATLREGMDADAVDSFNRSTQGFDPIEMFAAANALVQEGVARSTFVVIISGK